MANTVSSANVCIWKFCGYIGLGFITGPLLFRYLNKVKSVNANLQTDRNKLTEQQQQ